MPRLKVKEVAEDQGVNLSQLQRKANVAVRTARRYWFNTKSGNVTGEPLEELHLGVLKQIATALNVKVTDLIEDEWLARYPTLALSGAAVG